MKLFEEILRESNDEWPFESEEEYEEYMKYDNAPEYQYDDYFAIYSDGSGENDYWHGTDLDVLCRQILFNFGAAREDCKKSLRAKQMLDKARAGGALSGIKFFGSNLRSSDYKAQTIKKLKI
jgi:hypothetical protein